jgi:hypothetical protein
MRAPNDVPSNDHGASPEGRPAASAVKTALANCASIDECQDWANRAEALAS